MPGQHRRALEHPVHMSYAEAAKLLGVSLHTIQRWCKREGLPHVKVGRVVRIPDRELRAWIAERTYVADD